MNTKVFLMLVLIALILSGCQKPDAIPALSSTTELKDKEKIKPTLTQVQAVVKNGEIFALYLVADPQIAGPDLSQWTLTSSLSFDGVVIMDPAFSSNFSLSFALGYPTEEVFIGEDPRGDQRIREALKKAGLLE